MVQLSNVPRQQTHLRLAKDMSFSLGLWFRTKDQGRQFGSPVLPIPADYQGIDITDDEVRFVIYEQPRYGGAVVINEVATLVEPEHGYCRVDLQAADTNLLVAGRTYLFTVGWLAESYAGAAVQGELECVGNGIDDWIAETYTIDAPLNLGVELDERNHIHVVIDHLRAPDLDIGSVTTLAAGEDAGAYWTGAYPHQLLHLRIPRGPGGDPPSLEVGTVEVGDNENDAEVELVETGPGAYEMNFVLPRANVDAVGGIVHLDAIPAIIGDGTFNDGPLIQTTMDGLAAFGGGIVEGGLKTYGWDGVLQIPDGVRFTGMGREATQLKALGVTAKLRVGVWGDGDRPGGIFNIGIDGNGTGAADGLVHFQSVMAQMDDCLVFDGVGINVILDAAQNASITNCKITTAGTVGLGIKNGAGGYNFEGTHVISCPLPLEIFDEDETLNNAYPFGSAHLNFWGGIFEQYANGEAVFDISCGGAVVFWGTGFSVNGAVTMSEGYVGRISNDSFLGIGTYVTFNSCTFNGGDELYPGVVIDGNETVTFAGTNYIQQHDPGFCVVISGSPYIRNYGTFDEGDNVTDLFVADGGSLVSMFTPQHATLDFQLPAARDTVLSTRQVGKAGHQFRLHADGKHIWNEGDDFGIEQSLEFDVANDQMLFTGLLTMFGRVSLVPTALFANGDVDLDSKVHSHFQIVLTGAGHADNVQLTNPQPGAIALITFYADGGQAITGNADMVFHGGVAPANGPAVGKVLNVLASYDDIIDKWICRVFTDDPALAALVAPPSADLAAHLADATDAHDASAISFTPVGDLVADDVQEALAELDTEKATIAQAKAEVFPVALSDESTAITAGVAKLTMRMPFGFVLTGVRASLSTASSAGGPVTVDINEGGVSILSTKLTIDDGEKTSVTAAAAAVISDANLADDAEITFDIDDEGTGAKGLKVYLIGTRV
jgi:hypothetical protein